MVNTQIHVAAALPLSEEPQYSLNRRCGGPRKLVWTLRKRKGSQRESNLDSPNSSARSLHYPDSLLADKGPFVLVLVGEDKMSFWQPFLMTESTVVTEKYFERQSKKKRVFLVWFINRWTEFPSLWTFLISHYQTYWESHPSFYLLIETEQASQTQIVRIQSEKFWNLRLAADDFLSSQEFRHFA